MTAFISIQMIHLSLTGPNIPHSDRRQGRMRIALRFSIAKDFYLQRWKYLMMRNRICQRSKEAEAKTKEAETSSTNVETISLKEVHSTVDEFVENDKQNEDRKNTEHSDESDSGVMKFSSEREVQKLSEAEENLEHGKDTVVKHIGFNCSNTCEGITAALERAIRMYFENLSFCEGDVVKYHVLEEVERELAKEVLAKVRVACYEVHGSRISVMCESTTQE